MHATHVVACRVEPDAPLVCGEMTSRTLHFAAHGAIQPGGRIRLWFTQSPYYRLPPSYGLPAKGFIFFARVHFQTQDPRAAGYLTAVAASGRAVMVEVYPGKCFCDVVCTDGLSPGDVVRFTLGDTAHGGPGIEVAHHATYGDWPLVCEVDAAGDGGFVRQADMPTLRVVPAPPEQLLVRLLSQARPGIANDLHLTVIDRYGNHVEGYESAFTAAVDGGNVVDGLRLVADDNGVGRFADAVTLHHTGFGRVRVRLTGGTVPLVGLSNPIHCTADADGYSLLWGDLHGHTYCTDGTHSPQAYFAYARRIGGLDFCALTDHDTFSRDVWHEMVETAAQAYQPGRFTTLLGYEWQGDLSQTVVVYYRDAAGDYYPGHEPASHAWRDMRALVARHEAMVIRHDMPPAGQRWQALDESGRLERLVEIYAPVHASEAADAPLVRGALDGGNSVQAALADGLRFGFVGCSDTHLSMPGRRYSASKGYPNYGARPYGLTAVYAEANTREAVFAALRARRCYAATDRIYLDVRLNGHRMGEEVRLDGPRVLTVTAAGTAPFRAVDILKNNRVVHSAGAGEWETTFEYRDDATGDTRGDWYYVRVAQEDGGMAWASPIWVDSATR